MRLAVLLTLASAVAMATGGSGGSGGSGAAPGDEKARAASVLARAQITASPTEPATGQALAGRDDSSASDSGGDSSSSTSLPTPVVTIPSMNGNPYMSSSSLPEGMVFIAFGAVLGGLALALAVWRMAAAISLRRRLRKSEFSGPIMAHTPRYVDDKPGFLDASGHGGLAGAGGDLHAPGGPPGGSFTNDSLRKSTLGGTNLFFSPTADVMNSAGVASAGSLGASSTVGPVPPAGSGPHASVYGGGAPSRSSAYLPAGYYTPGANGGAGGAGSLSSRTTRVFSMAGHESIYNGATASARASIAPGTAPARAQNQRAPSAYLDDLLGHDAN